MSDASMRHCMVCGRVEYDCQCEEQTRLGNSAEILPHLSLEAKEGLWVLGRLDLLLKKGFVSVGSIKVSTRGLAEFDQLCASGFLPSPRVIRERIAQLNDTYETEVPDELVGLVYRYKEEVTT